MRDGAAQIQNHKMRSRPVILHSKIVCRTQPSESTCTKQSELHSSTWWGLRLAYVVVLMTESHDRESKNKHDNAEAAGGACSGLLMSPLSVQCASDQHLGLSQQAETSHSLTM
jgi:hypothetical protein